jgi:hypothetical protein
MCKTILVLSCLLTLPVVGKDPRLAATGEQQWKAEQLQRELTRVLSESGGKKKIHSESFPGPEGVYLVRAWEEGAYPGTRVVSTIVDRDGTSYGVHGQLDFSVFVRRRHWLRELPEVDEFMKLLDYAQFEAVLMVIRENDEPRLALEQGALVLKFTRGFIPNGRARTTIRIGTRGPLKIVESRK